MKENYIKILTNNNIKYFYHFTNLSNFESIIKNGLCSREYMNQNNISYTYTDKDRYDNQMDCISLSLNITNKSMLFKKSNLYNNEWIVFEINALKLINDYYNNIYYCKYNAASKSVVEFLNKNKNFLKTEKAFNNIFDENGNPSEQAELLVNKQIPMTYFETIYVSSLQIKMIVMDLLQNTTYENTPVIIRKEMFKYV